jgi:hypothetical protein
MLAPPRGVGGGLLQGGGAEAVLTGQAGRCGQAFGGARDPRGQDLALCRPLSLPLPLHEGGTARILPTPPASFPHRLIRDRSRRCPSSPWISLPPFGSKS